MNTNLKMRFLLKNNVPYIHVDDIVHALSVMGSTEEMDVRNRLNEFADNLKNTLQPIEGEMREINCKQGMQL